jgi:CDP-diacylglycerol--glycerol-3-phosphate 3-phosphatidyltransferase
VIKENVNPLPNILTSLRLFAGLIMFILLAGISGGVPFISPSLEPEDLDTMMRWAFVAFVIAALTDLFDGILARALHAQSRWGAILDPIADKILVCGTILGLSALGPQPSIALPTALILFREFAVSALREASAGKGIELPVTWLAKWKTAFQLVALGALLLVQAWSAFDLEVLYLDGFNTLAIGLIWFAAIATLWTGGQYFIAARKSV